MLEMLLNNQEVSIIGYPLSDTDPRMNKEWMMDHIDEIKVEISKNDSNPREELIKLNKRLNIDIDFEKIFQKCMYE